MRDFVYLLVLAFWVTSSSARAQPVLVVEPRRDDAALFEAYGRLCAELRLQRFELEVAEMEPSATLLETLDAEARRRGVLAAIAMVRREGAPGTAEIYLVDRVTGKLTLRRLTLEPSREGPTLLAVRAVELLRASLVELPAGERPPTDVLGVVPGPAPAPVERFAHRRGPFRVSAGALMLYHRELGAAWGPSLRLGAQVGPRVEVGAAIAAPVLGATYEEEGGTARLQRELFQAEAFLSLQRAEAQLPWELGLTLSVGAQHQEATGEVSAPLTAVTADSWGLAFGAALRSRYFFSPHLGLEGALGALVPYPSPVIAIDVEQSPPLRTHATASLCLVTSF